jgi:hypothetical protein
MPRTRQSAPRHEPPPVISTSTHLTHSLRPFCARRDLPRLRDARGKEYRPATHSTHDCRKRASRTAREISPRARATCISASRPGARRNDGIAARTAIALTPNPSGGLPTGHDRPPPDPLSSSLSRTKKSPGFLCLPGLFWRVLSRKGTAPFVGEDLSLQLRLLKSNPR